jgi:hypothetical protein
MRALVSGVRVAVKNAMAVLCDSRRTMGAICCRVGREVRVCVSPSVGAARDLVLKILLVEQLIRLVAHKELDARQVHECFGRWLLIESSEEVSQAARSRCAVSS